MSELSTIAVGSTNPVKANAIRLAFERMFPHRQFQVSPFAAASGVSDQPMSDEETLTGARNRLEQTRANCSSADFWAGIEGGIQDDSQGMNAFAWIVVQSREVRGEARTATFPLPNSVATLVRQGVELGYANDRVFGRHDSKHHEGAIGILTDNVIDRTMLYEHAAIMALVALKNESIYAACDV
ncbi:MAG: inosine/xanthosine triphosphatase [Pirellulaceae bacterium]|nr:inosine/xanthosine triphosphatase [Pirellulaceae bacterium]